GSVSVGAFRIVVVRGYVLRATFRTTLRCGAASAGNFDVLVIILVIVALATKFTVIVVVSHISARKSAMVSVRQRMCNSEIIVLVIPPNNAADGSHSSNVTVLRVTIREYLHSHTLY